MENKKSDIQPKKILLIEDETTMVNILTRKFEKVGYEVVVAIDGAEGLSMVETEKPDLILLDMVLPKKSGMSVLEELSKKGIIPDLPLIVISNSGEHVETEHAVELGARDYLVKVNFEPNELVEKVSAILSNGDTPAPLNSHPSNKEKASAVLVVEDDKLLSRLLTERFESRGYGVFVASSAGDAKKIIEKENIIVVCLDLVLPDKDGITFLKELKNDPKTKDIPVVIISNLNKKEDLEPSVEKNIEDYILKASMSPNDIVDRVEKLIDKK